AQSSNGGIGVPAGTLIINGGTNIVNTVIAGAGTSTITLNSGTMIVTNRVGTPGAGISTFTTPNSSLHVRLNGNSVITNFVVTTLTASGITTFSIDSVTNVNVTTTFPLISYASFGGSIANFALSSLPANFAGTLTNNTAAQRIDLIITHAPATPVIAS